jgi:nicotinamide mononucleotide transporter
MMINGYYFVMSIYGWYHWTRKKGDAIEFPISKFPAPKTNCDNSFYIYSSLCGFGISLFRKIYHLVCLCRYIYYGIFFVGMWLMAKRKVENWIFWIIEINFNSTIFSKGFTFTSFQYIVFTIVAILAI